MPLLYAYLALIVFCLHFSHTTSGYIRGGIRRICVQNIRNTPSAHVCVPVWRMAWAVWFRTYMGRMFPSKKRPSEKVLARIQKMGNLAAIICMVADYRRCPSPRRRLAQAQCFALRHHSDYRQTAALCHDLLGDERSGRISFHNQK